MRCQGKMTYPKKKIPRIRILTVNRRIKFKITQRMGLCCQMMMKKRKGIFILLSDLQTTKTSTTRSLRNKTTNITSMRLSIMRHMSP